MGGIGVVFYEVMIHVFQLVIFSLCGAGLAKQGAFDRIGEFKSAEANLHLFIPMFEIVTFSKAIHGLSSNELGLLFFTFVISSAFAWFFGFLHGRVFKMDVRARRVFALICTFGDVAFLPSVLAGALCLDSGPFHGDPHCASNFHYSFYVLFLFNFSLLLSGPYFMHTDQAVSQHIARKMMLIRHYYPKSPQDFLDDTHLTKLDDAAPLKGSEVALPIMGSPEKPVDTAHMPDRLDTAAHLTGKVSSLKEIFETVSKDKADAFSIFDNDELMEYSYSLHMDTATAEKFETHFNLFLNKIKPEVFSKLYLEVPNIQIPPAINLPFVRGWLTSRPIWGCILSVIFGRIPDVMEWLFEDNQVVKAFMGTIEHISELAIPLAVMVWGMELIKGFHLQGRNLRIIDVVAMVLIRLAIVPAIGLGFAHGLLNDGISELDNNPVLSFHIYANWCVPPGLLLLTLFVLCKYFALEGAIIMFWCKLLCIVFSTLYTWAYMGMMDLSFPDVPYKAA